MISNLKKLSCIILCGILLMGCSVSEGSSITEEGREETTKEESKEEYIPIEGDFIKIAMRNPSTLHPIYNTEKSVEQSLYLFFDTLINIETDGSVTPNLAKKWYMDMETNSIHITLEENIKWHDGKPLTAHDVKFTIDTIQQATKSPYKKNVENIAKVQVLTDNVLQIWYRQPFSGSLQTLFFPIIPEHVYNVQKEVAYELKPVGSGPYKLKEEIPLKELTLQANDNYFKGKPEIEIIKIMITPDEESTLHAFEQGLIDVIYTDVMDWGKYTKDKSAKIYEIPTNNYEFMGINFNKTQFQNRNVREALVYGLNRKEIIDIYYLGQGIVTDTPISPKSYLFDKTLDIKSYDKEKAKLLLAQEGYQLDDKTKLFTKNNLPLTFSLLVNKENKERVKVAHGIQKMYKNIGIEVKIEEVEKEVYLERIYAKQYDAFLGGWKLSYIPDLSFAFHSSEIIDGDNFISYQDTQMDTLLKEAFIANPEYIVEAYSGLQHYFADQNPYISLYFRNGAVITKKKIKGNIEPDPLNIYANIKEWKLED